MKTYLVKYSYYENDPEKMQCESKVFTNKQDAETYKAKLADSLDNLMSIKIEETEEKNPNVKSKYPICRKIFADKDNGYQFLLRYKKDGTLLYAHKYYDSFNNRLDIKMLKMNLTRYRSLDDTIDDIFTIDFADKKMVIYSFQDKYRRKYNKKYIITSILSLLEKGEIEIIDDDVKVIEPIINFEIVHLEEILGYQPDQVV